MLLGNCRFLAMLALLIFNISSAKEVNNNQKVNGALLDVYAAFSRPIYNTAWHSSMGSAVVEAHSVRLDLETLQTITPPQPIRFGNPPSGRC